MFHPDEYRLYQPKSRRLVPGPKVYLFLALAATLAAVLLALTAPAGATEPVPLAWPATSQKTAHKASPGGYVLYSCLGHACLPEVRTVFSSHKDCNSALAHVRPVDGFAYVCGREGWQ